ncbi:carboxylesterase [Streptomyces albireticuli]|uniref:Carboxylesterase n=1 Tax=Streptomyces albireticuli TaxID=1940 RepID=A0A1Z2LDZ0_9ACTN|nr:hypothetical protein [Streptomyces albireticuli]ARZ72502.1 carboxylesterase [Streptomyces albireticuli]
MAEAHSAAGGPAYLAELCGRSPALGGALGACHSLDVPLLFGTFGSPAGRGLLGEGAPSAGTVAFADGLRRAWTAFAHDGDPGWPAYEPGRRLTRLLGPASTTAPYPEETSRRIWDGHGIEPFDLVRPHRQEGSIRAESVCAGSGAHSPLWGRRAGARSGYPRSAPARRLR